MNPANDRDLIEGRLRPWLSEEGMVREPEDLFERVTIGMRRVRQRPGWLVRLMGNGMTGAGAGPTARWREHKMATTLGLGTVVIALAVGIGGIGSGLFPDQGVVPGAEEAPDTLAPGIAKIEIPEADHKVIKEGDFTSRSGVRRYEDLRQEWVWDASDPRLSGVVTTVDNWHSWLGQDMQVEATAYELVNDGGRWTGTGTGLVIESIGDLPYGRLNSAMIVLDGEDGYEGLSALVYMDWADGYGEPVIHGVIFPGEMPYPELPAE